MFFLIPICFSGSLVILMQFPDSAEPLRPFAQLLRAGPSVKPSTMVRPYFPAGQQLIPKKTGAKIFGTGRIRSLPGE